MKLKNLFKSILFTSIILLSIKSFSQLNFTYLSTFKTNLFDASATEIAAYDKQSKRVFSTNASTGKLDIVDISNPLVPVLIKSIDLSNYGSGANSVACYNGIIAAAVENSNPQMNGKVVFFDSAGTYINQVVVGAMPDMITFTKDGKKVITANEGEPDDNYSVDPLGSVSIIDVSGNISNINSSHVKTLDFTYYNSQNLDKSTRVFGNNGSSTPAQDFEPEYVAVSEDSKKAWVSLQENNAFAIIDLVTDSIIGIKGLGFKNHGLSGNELDPSDKDNIAKIRKYDKLFGMYQPDAIKSFSIGSTNYIVSANEGDSRDYSAFSEEVKISSLNLDISAFPNAAILQNDSSLGRLIVTNTLGDSDNDNDYDSLYVFGTRSFSIWDDNGNLIFDSGSDFEQILINSPYSNNFNSNNDDNNSFDKRSDNKGCEPEAIELIKDGNKIYALIGLERMGGFMVYDISNPNSPSFITYVTKRDFSIAANVSDDMGPENILFIPSNESPNNQALILVSNEISGSITIFSVSGLTTEIYELDKENYKMTLYPNPATTVINTNKVSSYIISDITGKIINTYQNTSSINIKNLTSGLYFIKDLYNQQISKFIKE